jgi:signal transduction histidine kinase
MTGVYASTPRSSESTLEQERMLLAQRLESLGVLAGGVVHDLINDLGSILAKAEATLLEIDNDSRARAGLDQIAKIAVRASRIARQVITYVGKGQEDLEPVDLSHVIKEMLQFLRACVPRDTKLEIELPASLPAIRGNPIQIQQIVMNLVLNAREAIGDTGGVIRIAAQQRSMCGNLPALNETAEVPDGEVICLEISDTGVGMTDEVRERIFDPFFSTKPSGCGLGLAAVQEIVRIHAATIEVRTTPGEGTTFQILFRSEAAAADSSVADSIQSKT